MASDILKDHLNRLKEQTDALRETLSAFRANYNALQFGMNRLEDDLRRSREEFELMTGKRKQDASVVQLKLQKDADRQLTA